jgi:hypothetical protein
MAVAADQPESLAPARPWAERVTTAIDRNVFTISVLAALCAVQGLLVRGAVTADSWYTLVGGRLVAGHGLPRRDSLTLLTLGRIWPDQQWLGHLTLYEAWSAGGWGLVGALSVVMYTGAFAITALGARLGGASDRSVAVVAAACFLVGLPNAAVRAQLLAYPLFAAVLALLLADVRRPSRRVYLVFPVLVLWANVHGSVVLGAALVALRGLVLAWSAIRQRGLVGRAAALTLAPWLCALASPYALVLPGYYRRLFDNPTLAHSVSEWGPSSIRGQPVFFVLLLAALWLASRWSRALTPFAQLVLWVTALAGLLALRDQVWFALAAAAVVPAAFDAAWRPAATSRHRTLNLVLATTLIVAAAVLIGRDASRGAAWYQQNFPPAAAAAAASTPGARVFATERYADWLLFAEPQLHGRIAYDVRFELLTDRQLRSIVNFRNEHGLDWQRAAHGYRVLVLNPSGDVGAVRYYRGLRGTSVLFRDKRVIVLRLGAPGRPRAVPPSN